MERMIPHKKLMPGIYQGTPEPVDQKKNEPPRLIRTMKMDTGEAIRNQNETEVSIALAEEKKRAIKRAESEIQKIPEVSAPLAPKPIGRIIVILLIFLIITLLGLAYVYILPKLGAIKLPDISFLSFSKGVGPIPPPIVATPLAPSLVPAQHEMRFNISEQTQSQILVVIATEMNQVLPVGSIKNLYFSEGNESVPPAISTNRFFTYMGAQVPEILTRSLERPFMVGLFGDTAGRVTPFIILKVSSYESGLAGMLEWETSLPNFFSSVFGTSAERSAISTTKFSDIIILQKDARQFKTTFGGFIVYAFANPNTIVITGSRATLEALLPVATKK